MGNASGKYKGILSRAKKSGFLTGAVILFTNRPGKYERKKTGRGRGRQGRRGRGRQGDASAPVIKARELVAGEERMAGGVEGEVGR